MKALHKKLVSVLLICMMLIGGAVAVNHYGTVPAVENVFSTESEETEARDEAYVKAETDLVFWYEDASYKDFFEKAAELYYKKTGTKVAVMHRDTMDYLGDIYDETMQDASYPDVYLIAGQNLEEAYLYGLVGVNRMETNGLGMKENAIKAATYHDKLLGYPLSFNVCVFIYQNGYFESEPESLQAIIDYSDENEPGENVEYLLEWDVNDAFYDFPFVSNCLSFEKSEMGRMNVEYDEELYAKDLEYFEQILESFSVNADTVSEEEIISNFLAGRTLCAIVDSDLLCELEGYDYSLMQIPDLNEELSASTCALTDMIVVNEYSKNADEAADFAEFVTVELAGELYDATGHMSVIQEENLSWTKQVAYESYDSAVLAPDSQDARDFWVRLEETISKYF